jgi:hypothetical protein
VNRSELGLSRLLPTGMATLLLADVEGSTGFDDDLCGSAHPALRPEALAYRSLESSREVGHGHRPGMSMVSPSTTFNTVAVAVVGSATATFGGAMTSAVDAAASCHGRRPLAWRRSAQMPNTRPIAQSPTVERGELWPVVCRRRCTSE